MCVVKAERILAQATRQNCICEAKGMHQRKTQRVGVQEMLFPVSNSHREFNKGEDSDIKNSAAELDQERLQVSTGAGRGGSKSTSEYQ